MFNANSFFFCNHTLWEEQKANVFLRCAFSPAVSDIIIAVYSLVAHLDMYIWTTIFKDYFVKFEIVFVCLLFFCKVSLKCQTIIVTVKSHKDKEKAFCSSYTSYSTYNRFFSHTEVIRTCTMGYILKCVIK